ncbi:MAG: hypothetical protein AABX65_02030 [Nanoarchaeota archaeon]
MVNRKKRLKKGISSIAEQIMLHEKKKEQAKELGYLDLEHYFEKEIIGMKKAKEKKEEQLDN